MTNHFEGFECWACGSPAPALDSCSYCGAPDWWDFGTLDGVYVVSVYVAGVGQLYKIGWSRASIIERIAGLNRLVDKSMRIEAVLPGAEKNIEAFIHHRLRLHHAEDAARSAHLPAPTEWFHDCGMVHELIGRRPFLTLPAEIA